MRTAPRPPGAYQPVASAPPRDTHQTHAPTPASQPGPNADGPAYSRYGQPPIVAVVDHGHGEDLVEPMSRQHSSSTFGGDDAPHPHAAKHSQASSVASNGTAKHRRGPSLPNIMVPASPLPGPDLHGSTPGIIAAYPASSSGVYPGVQHGHGDGIPPRRASVRLARLLSTTSLQDASVKSEDTGCLVFRKRLASALSSAVLRNIVVLLVLVDLFCVSLSGNNGVNTTIRDPLFFVSLTITCLLFVEICLEILALGKQFVFRQNSAGWRVVKNPSRGPLLLKARGVVVQLSSIRWLALLEASVAITAFAINVAHAVSASSVPIPVSGIVIIRLARVLRLLKLSGWRSERAADAITNSEERRTFARDYGTEEAHGHVASAASATYLASRARSMRAPAPPPLGTGRFFSSGTPMAPPAHDGGFYFDSGDAASDGHSALDPAVIHLHHRHHSQDAHDPHPHPHHHRLPSDGHLDAHHHRRMSDAHSDAHSLGRESADHEFYLGEELQFAQVPPARHIRSRSTFLVSR